MIKKKTNSKKQTLAIYTFRNGDEDSHAYRSEPDIIVIIIDNILIYVYHTSLQNENTMCRTNAENSLPKEVCITLLTKHIINNNEWGFILLCF